MRKHNLPHGLRCTNCRTAPMQIVGDSVTPLRRPCSGAHMILCCQYHRIDRALDSSIFESTLDGYFHLRIDRPMKRLMV